MIVLAIPTRDSILATTVMDIYEFQRQTSVEVILAMSCGSYIPNNRIKLVEQTLASDATHILFIDSDMRFPFNTAGRLMRANKDIIGANCRQRTANEWTARKGDKFVSSTGKTGLEEVDTLGFGVTLIDMKVFNGKLRKVPEPWFAMPYHTQDKKLVGEDVYFCTVAKEQGFNIWVDHDLSQEVKHTGAQEF